MKKLKMYQALKVVFASAGVIVSVSACSGEESISTTTDSAIESDVSSLKILNLLIIFLLI